MMRRRALVLWLSCALAILVAGCSGSQPRPDGPMIDALDIEGAQAIPSSQVKKKILTTSSSVFPWWLYWLPLVGEDEYFDANAWQSDLRRIERYYQSEGYYQAKVVDDEVAETKPGHVSLQVKLKEGEATKVTEVSVVGLDALEPDQKTAVSEKLPVKVGEVFREVDWAQAKATIVSRLLEIGYAEAVVEGEATVDLETRTAVLALGAKPGTRYKFGKVFVANDPDAKVPPQWIVEQVENVIKVGDWYSESALNEAQTLVFQMGVFGAVKVNRGAPDRNEGTVPVVVDVREAPFRSARLGPGLGVDALRQKVYVTGEFTHRNFLGGLRRFSVRGQVGWAWLPAIWDPKQKNGLVALITHELEQPRFLGARNLTGFALVEVSSGLEPAYTYIGGTASVGVRWHPYSTVTITPSYNLNVYLLTAQVPLGSRAPEALFGCPLVCLISYFEQVLEWDRRDSKLEPKTGTYVGLSLQEGGPPGVFTFLRVQPEVRGYLSFGEEKKVTLAAKLKVGTLHSFNKDAESPIMARFFSGGSSMRGFSTRRLSPLLEVARQNTPPPAADPPPHLLAVNGETIPIGGKGLLEASVELRWNLWGDLVLATFSDTGMVTWESLGESANQLQYLYTSVGLGARYRTPLGQIRLDFAVRLPVGATQRINPTGKLDPRILVYDDNGGCFGLGSTKGYAGSPEGICAFHLSIGEAF